MPIHLVVKLQNSKDNENIFLNIRKKRLITKNGNTKRKKKERKKEREREKERIRPAADSSLVTMEVSI